MRFTKSATKYDNQGKALPKGREFIKKWKKNNPNSLPFDSLSEWRTWSDLTRREKMGKIQNLKRQVTFELIPQTRWFNNLTGKLTVVRPMSYIADFTFLREGKMVVLDCKGWKQIISKKTGKTIWKVYKDEIYNIKKKIFLNKYPDIIFEES